MAAMIFRIGPMKTMRIMMTILKAMKMQTA